MRSKVSLVRCDNYQTESVYEAVKRSIDLLAPHFIRDNSRGNPERSERVGGINTYVKEGQRVLIKPNLLSAKPPESGIDTHPEVVRAVIRLVKEAGGRVSVGDSPGGSVKKIAGVYEASGIAKVCREEDVPMLNFEKIEMFKNIPIARAALKADVLISVPKFKTHSLMTMTGGVKNLFGIVPGLFKTECHKRAPNPDIFADLLVDVYSYARPHLSVIDGIIGMEGDGPATAGTLRQMDLIAASSDAVSLDAVLAKIIGLEPFDISTTREADLRGLGIGRLDYIDIVGEKLDNFVQSDFKLPKTSILHRIPSPVLKFIAGFFKDKPDIDQDKCKNCGICIKSCPKQAIAVKDGQIKIDCRQCILCLCCHEFCPENAVFIKENLFFRIIRS